MSGAGEVREMVASFWDDRFAEWLVELRSARARDAHASRCEVVRRRRAELRVIRARLAELERAEAEAERMAPSLFGEDL